VGEEVLAADFNTMVQRQVVATFANAAARTAAIPSPSAGMVSYLTDIQAVHYYDGTVWRSPSGVIGTIEMLTNSGGVTTAPAPSTLIVTATVPGGHRIKVSACVTMQQTVASSGAIHVSIYQDGAAICQAAAVMPLGFLTLNPERVVTPSAGSHTWQVYVWTDAGNALIAGTVSPATLLVEDLGT
jgi:hypothetical protein